LGDSSEIEKYLVDLENEQNLIDVEFDKFVSEQEQTEALVTSLPQSQAYFEGADPFNSAGYMEEYRFDLNGNVIYSPEMLSAAYVQPYCWTEYGAIPELMQQCSLNSTSAASTCLTGRMPEICRYFPSCKYGNSCRFFHPDSTSNASAGPVNHSSETPNEAPRIGGKRSQMCRYFPNCNFGDKCVFYHPKQQK
jgi:hypothetical protein